MRPKKMKIVQIPEECAICEIVDKNIHHKGENESNFWNNSLAFNEHF